MATSQSSSGNARSVGRVRCCDAKADWRHVGKAYRKLIFGIGEETSQRAGISAAEVEAVWATGGELSLAQLLRCRIRNFTDGLALGSESFIERVFKANRGIFSADRKDGTRKMKGGDWGEMRTARALRIDPIAPG